MSRPRLSTLVLVGSMVASVATSSARSQVTGAATVDGVVLNADQPELTFTIRVDTSADVRMSDVDTVTVELLGRNRGPSDGVVGLWVADDPQVWSEAVWASGTVDPSAHVAVRLGAPVGRDLVVHVAPLGEDNLDFVGSVRVTAVAGYVDRRTPPAGTVTVALQR